MMRKEELIEELLERARRLHPIQVGLVLDLATILEEPVEVARNPRSDFVNSEFVVAFGNRLLMHHAFTYAPLTKKHFEYAFEAAANESGSRAKVVKSSTNPGEDITLNGARCSLKTEAAASIRESVITVSKLSEARWIQQCSTLEQLVEALVQRFPAQLDRSDRIIMLRFLNRSGNVVEYQLVEIPLSLLSLVTRLTVADFTSRSGQGGTTARIMDGENYVFSIRLDGSDGKISISNLLLDRCVLHATWRFVASRETTGNGNDA